MDFYQGGFSNDIVSVSHGPALRSIILKKSAFVTQPDLKCTAKVAELKAFEGPVGSVFTTNCPQNCT
jgi:hypothetical protein